MPSTSGSTAGAFADLLGQPVPSSAPQYEPVTAYEKDGIRVVFRLSKPAGQESVTDIEASYSNTSSQPISDFSLQVGNGSLACGPVGQCERFQVIFAHDCCFAQETTCVGV